MTSVQTLKVLENLQGLKMFYWLANAQTFCYLQQQSFTYTKLHSSTTLPY